MTIKGTEEQDEIIQEKRPTMRVNCIIALIILVAGVALSFTTISDWYSETISIEKSELLTAKVFRGDLIREITVSGKLFVSNSEQLYNDEAGEVTIHYHPGDDVKAGQVIATIRNQKLPALIKQHSADLDQLKIQIKRGELADQETQLTLQRQLDKVEITLHAAQREKKRLEKLFDKGLISTLTLEKVHDQLLEAKLTFAYAQQKAVLIHQRLQFEQENREIAVSQQSQLLDELLRRQESLQVKTSITGIVGSWQVKQKEQLSALTPLLIIIDQSQYEAKLNVPEFSSEDLRIGQVANLTAAGKKLSGVIQSISPQIINNQIQVNVSINTKDKQTFKIQQRINGTIELAKKENILMVKRGAFINSGYSREAFKIIDGLAIRSPIKLGISSTKFVEVISGVQENDHIIISDHADFQEQQKIRLIN
ncbi:MAG: HlyD family efflux transporter periplasmic adaptor subunit [Psychromonas sp.]|nr:HlyD family efflux transporter periplasmic adaptor subunit [Psychromonas sp.]